MAVTPATAGPYLPHIRAASPSRGPLASYFPFLSLWLRGGVEETEVKELPTVVWGLRNTSLLILSNKKKKISFSFGWILAVSCTHFEGRKRRHRWKAKPCLRFPSGPFSVSWFRGGQGGFDMGQDLEAVVR